jgi:Predicted outer membrane protein
MRTALRTSLIGISAAAVALTGLALPRPAAAQALNDPTIVAIFDAANTWDIATGGLAARRAKSKEVREFGQMLVRDHKAVRQQGRDLAKKLHVTPTPPKNFGMAKDHAVAMAKLSKLHGAAFDKAFLEHEVAYHKAVLDAVTTTLLPALKNAEVKDMVTKVGPAFQAHMMKAQSLLDSYPK